MALTQATELADFTSGIGTAGAILEVDNNNNRIGIGTTNPQALLQVGQIIKMDGPSGIVTATTFSGNFTGNIAGNATGLTGAPDITVNNIIGVGATFSGEVTYEDVTNIDSVGVVTARSGIHVNDSITHIGDTNTKIRFPSPDTFTVETAGTERLRVNSDGVVAISTGFTVGGDLNVTGISTFQNNVHLLDDDELRLGDSNDLRIYHSGFGRIISTGALTLSADDDINLDIGTDTGDTVNIRGGSGGSETLAIFALNGSVDLYYDNVKRFETTSTGVVITGALTATSFVGALTGNVTGAASQVTVADESSDTTCFPLFATAATGNLPPKSGTNLTFNSSTGALTATSFVGAVTGAVTGNADTATTATNVTVADESSDTTCFPLFTTAATGNLPPKSGTNLTFNSSTGALTATSGAFSERTQVGTGALSDVALAVYNDTTTANEPTLYIQNDQSGGNLLQGFGGGSEKVKITAAGAATFAGEVYSGGNAFNGGANGSRLSPGGAIYASAGSGSLWTGYTTGSSSSTSTISAEGSASFKAPSGNGVVVQTAGGNEGSKFPFVGKNTSGTTTFSVNGDGTATFAGTVTAGTVSDSIGPLRRLGIQNKTANYTLVSGDAGKLIRITTGTITVPASVFTAGDMVSIFNVGSGNVTVSSSAVTVYNSADGDTGNTRTIAAKGMVTLVCTATNEFVISGSQLT